MMGQSRTRLLGVMVLIAMFAAGGLTGAVLQRSATADNRGQSRSSQRGPNLFETLKLTQEQQDQVCAIVERKAEQMRPHEMAFQAAWKEHEPAMKAIISATNAEVDSVLTPEQRVLKDQFRAERAKYFRERQEKSKQQQSKPGENGPRRDTARGGPGRPGSNPLGVKCPNLQNNHGGMTWRGGDSSQPAPQGK
jgi:hypothetical protein